MARILNRPMFRRGGSTGGITANLNKPRMGFEPGGQVPSYQEILAQYMQPPEEPKAVIISSGSEIGISINAAKKLGNVRVVSMPCTERFDIQDDKYKESVLGKGLPRLAVESSHKDWWFKYVGLEGEVLGMESFGESAPGNILEDHFGFNEENILKILKNLIK